MSTKQHTDTTNVYNKGSMGAYNTFQPQIQSFLLQSMANPLASSYFQNQLAQQRAQVNQLQGNSVRNTLQNARAGGGILSNSAGFTSALLNRQGISGNLMQANAFNSALNNALNTRNYAASAMQSYQPLQTGQNSVSYKSGLGTWLGPALAAAAPFASMIPGVGPILGAAMSGASGQGGGGFPTNPGRLSTPGPAMSAPQLPFGGVPGSSLTGLGNSFYDAMSTPYRF